MKTAKEKMLAGELNDPLDHQFSRERRCARLLLKALDDTRDDQVEERARLIKELIPSTGTGVWIEPPFYCDYGSNITLGDNVLLNFSCILLECSSGANRFRRVAYTGCRATICPKALQEETSEAGETVSLFFCH
jgi:acetyltransferase-like isoleucine patch superfamily enzyme